MAVSRRRTPKQFHAAITPTHDSCILEDDPEILRPNESEFDPTDMM
jgi:hypothetical protein